MLKIKGLTIEVSQGDYLPVRFNFSGYVLEPDDTVTLAISTIPPLRYEQQLPGESSVVFEFPTYLPVGDYSYDISIQFADKKVRTLNWLWQGNLIIKEIAR